MSPKPMSKTHNTLFCTDFVNSYAILNSYKALSFCTLTTCTLAFFPFRFRSAHAPFPRILPRFNSFYCYFSDRLNTFSMHVLSAFYTFGQSSELGNEARLRSSIFGNFHPIYIDSHYSRRYPLTLPPYTLVLIIIIIIISQVPPPSLNYVRSI